MHNPSSKSSASSYPAKFTLPCFSLHQSLNISPFKSQSPGIAPSCLSLLLLTLGIYATLWRSRIKSDLGDRSPPPPFPSPPAHPSHQPFLTLPQPNFLVFFFLVRFVDLFLLAPLCAVFS
ncbi:hypothetical protein FRC18_006118 [Serendipita sp. 400]|nr:hypothetical protein FRC18_006118 [Serendipita sp. 400]